MAFYPVENTAKVAIEGEKNGALIVMTTWSRKLGGYAQEDIDALAAAVDDWVAEGLLTWLPPDYTYTQTKVRGMADAFDFFSSADAGAGPGVYTGEGLPNNVALSVSRRSFYTGRATRGRVYIPLASEALVDASHVSSGFADGVADTWDTLRVAMASEGWDEVIVHRKSGGTWLSTGVCYPVVDYICADTRTDSMRRRLPKSLA